MSKPLRKALSGLAILGLALAGLFVASQLSADETDSVRRISAVDALKAMAEGKAVLVDVRGSEAFASEHAVGALDIPSYQLAAHLKDLPKNKLIITYCT